jgi:hypothetical protein
VTNTGEADGEIRNAIEDFDLYQIPILSCAAGRYCLHTAFQRYALLPFSCRQIYEIQLGNMRDLIHYWLNVISLHRDHEV